MKIYVITRGAYSDYHICAVATDKEKAIGLAEFYSNKYDPAEVEEYDTDETPDLTKGKKMYRISFAPSGDVDTFLQVTPNYFDVSEIPYETEYSPGVVFVHVQANNEEDAIKIGAEIRAKYLAEKHGL